MNSWCTAVEKQQLFPPETSMSAFPNITKKLSNYCSHDLGLDLQFKTPFDCLTRTSFQSPLPRFNYESDSTGKARPVAFKYWRNSTRQFEKGFLFDCESPIRGRECLPCRSFFAAAFWGNSSHISRLSKQHIPLAAQAVAAVQVKER